MTKPGIPLDPRAREILAFEAQWFEYQGVKEQRVRELFGVSLTRFYQELNAILDDPRALEFDPVNVNRLRRIRTARQLSRPTSRRV